MHLVLNFPGHVLLAQVSPSLSFPTELKNGNFWSNEIAPGFIVWRVLLALLVVILSLFFKNALRAILSRVLLHAMKRKTVVYEDLILEAAREPFGAFILVFGFELATQLLLGGLERFQVFNVLVTAAFEVALGVILIWTFYRFVNVAAAFFDNVVLAHDSSLSPQLTPLFSNTLRVIILTIGALTLLSSLHVNVVSLLAGLGVGGIAVALALQDPLGNFFGSITLIADRSFRVGDWIQMGTTANRVDGIVEEIGFRSTRVRTFSRTRLTIPNNMLCKDIIENFSATPQRRVNQKLGVSFQTSPEQIRAFVAAIGQAVKAEDGVVADGGYYYFHDITANGYEIIINYFTKPIDPTEHLAVKERVNYRLVELAREHGLTLNNSANNLTPAARSASKPEAP
jgi:MscS family membrane protein